MIVNFYLKEDSNVGQESITITIIKNSNNKNVRSHITNSKNLSDFTAIEQQAIKTIISTVEKYKSDAEGGTELNYGL